jgi:hypothetical protein
VAKDVAQKKQESHGMKKNKKAMVVAMRTTTPTGVAYLKAKLKLLVMVGFVPAGLAAMVPVGGEGGVPPYLTATSAVSCASGIMLLAQNASAKLEIGIRYERSGSTLSAYAKNHSSKRVRVKFKVRTSTVNPPAETREFSETMEPGDSLHLGGVNTLQAGQITAIVVDAQYLQ